MFYYLYFFSQESGLRNVKVEKDFFKLESYCFYRIEIIKRINRRKEDDQKKMNAVKSFRVGLVLRQMVNKVIFREIVRFVVLFVFLREKVKEKIEYLEELCKRSWLIVGWGYGGDWLCIIRICLRVQVVLFISVVFLFIDTDGFVVFL